MIEPFGNCSYTVQSSNPLWGHSAGLEIMLHPLIQKSVVKTVYRVMLESMIERRGYTFTKVVQHNQQLWGSAYLWSARSSHGF